MAVDAVALGRQKRGRLLAKAVARVAVERRHAGDPVAGFAGRRSERDAEIAANRRRRRGLLDSIAPASLYRAIPVDRRDRGGVAQLVRAAES